MTQGNTIILQLHKDINSSLELERQEQINSNNSIPGNRNISCERNKELLDKTIQNRLYKHNNMKQDKTSIPPSTAL